jgi:ABC-type transport system involved in multi-copper enzyme maturation permease subunit
MHLVQVVRSKRILVLFVLAVLPPMIAWLGLEFGPSADRASHHGGPDVLRAVVLLMHYQVVLPILALVAGSAVVTEEIENRTCTYLFTRPIPRAALLLGRWLATLVVVLTLLLGSAMAVVWAVRSHGQEAPADLVQHALWGLALGGAVYSGLGAVLGVFLKRPMIVCLGYAFAFEVGLANVPGSTQRLSLQYYLRSILVEQDQAFDSFRILRGVEVMSPGDASLRLILVLLLALGVGCWFIQRRQYVLTS